MTKSKKKNSTATATAQFKLKDEQLAEEMEERNSEWEKHMVRVTLTSYDCVTVLSLIVAIHSTWRVFIVVQLSTKQIKQRFICSPC